MYTSDTDHKLRTCASIALKYLLVSCFCALFGGIYELFSHEVYAHSMLYAFAYPLVGGVLPFLALGLSPHGRLPGSWASVLYHCGIGTLTLGSIVEGVLIIYGTTHFLTLCYPVAGWLLVGIGILLWLINSYSKKPR